VKTPPSQTSLFFKMNWLDSQSRNKAKNALSLAVPISPELAGAKIGKISFGWRKKKQIFQNLPVMPFPFGE
jgi:hypothetical protein